MEPQKPFITQGGKLSNMGAVPPLDLLAPMALAVMIAELRREQELRGTLYPGWIANDRLDEEKAFDQLGALERAIQSLAHIQGPTVNTVLTALAALEPSFQALVSDIALALATPGSERQRLANGLRKLVDGRP